MGNYTSMSKTEKETKIYFYPALGKTVKAFSREEANKEVETELEKAKSEKADDSKPEQAKPKIKQN